MICQSCRSEVSSTAKFCEACGTKIIAAPVRKPGFQFCRKCNSEIEADSRFCENRGAIQPDRCICGQILSPVAAFCIGCGNGRPASARPMFDLTEFAEIKQNMVCKLCLYQGAMPVVDQRQTNHNPLAGTMMICSSLTKAIGVGIASNIINEVMTTDHAYLICPNCRKLLKFRE
jgi:hypothetical protein